MRNFNEPFFFFNDTATTEIYTLSLHDALPIWTHDSISVGEDGPTHQPVEHLAALRAMPGMLVIRPADANEVVEAYRLVLSLEDRPACLVLSRQPLPTLDRSTYGAASGLAKGGYILADPPDGKPDVLLLATGSELSLCLAARDRLLAEGVQARVVSLPCWELFDEQPQDYREGVLPPEVTARVAVEQAATFGWERYAGPQGTILGMRSFGLSAPMKVVAQHFGFEPEQI